MSKIRILAFDPGEMTGISYMVDGKFVWGMVATRRAFESGEFLPSLIKITSPTIVVAEVPPTADKIYNDDQTYVFIYVKNWFTTAGFRFVPLTPGQWKGIGKPEDISCTHIKDATGMSALVYRKELSNEGK